MIDLAGKKAIILGGRTGLLGRTLTEKLQEHDIVTIPLSRNDFDPLNEESLSALLERKKPDLIFNTIAYTKVDQAEDEENKAHLLNTTFPAMLARLAKSQNCKLIHFSTDFVFDGKKDSPYTETDPTNPQSVYGDTKLSGEEKLLESGYENILIIRTAWLFGPYKTNFIHKILNFARERENLTVVHDQSGSPTYTPDLAEYTIALLKNEAKGIFNVVNSGKASWCELADEAISCSAINCRVDPVPTSAYPTKAKRPPYSVLDTSKLTEVTGITPRPWVQALRDYIYNDLKNHLED
ncbi:dTDP-4-dehydrorhamnose reductase [Maridesulfovibrio hydrothermalis]|uniref:dTDP-4-dehydrorhamnose reductase n=1 Tax=Maridesulfovibrio hydrothermalis AM13 = DSM 14728 TaxID=1121451 RepID=L0RC17_9BACT|nr:dTDP-4-dehydrorhamnose reductase [Maridesulfovibrio hydrothermalis]CCO24323.1 dTDP-4-dehydrorhamnose reductase [Maridesulfovibrio hydrothermalis AM13 = DSM 14728]